MSNYIQSSISLSLKQLINKKMLKIFLLHFLLTYTIAGIIVYYCSEFFVDYFNEIISNIFNFFSLSNSSENLISSILIESDLEQLVFSRFWVDSTDEARLVDSTLYGAVAKEDSDFPLTLLVLLKSCSVLAKSSKLPLPP